MAEEITNEISEMLKALESSTDLEQALEPESDSSTIQDNKLESPQGDDKSEISREPSQEPEPKPEPKTTPSEPDDKDKTIEGLRRKVADLEVAKAEPPPSPPPPPEPPPASSIEEPLSLDFQDFVGDLDIDDITENKESLNKLLNTVYSKGISDSRRIVGEGILRSIPETVRNNLTLISALKETSDKFYEDNKDLVSFKKVVAAVFEDLASQNPNKPYNEVITLVAPEVRKRLELHERAVVSPDKDSPRLPTSRGGPRPASGKPNISPLHSEIDEMNKSLGR